MDRQGPWHPFRLPGFCGLRGISCVLLVIDLIIVITILSYEAQINKTKDDASQGTTLTVLTQADHRDRRSRGTMHKGGGSGPAAGLLLSYGPLHVSWCTGLSPGISSMLWTLCWETQQTFLPQLALMCHPEWASLPEQLLWVGDTALCYL